MKKQLLQNTSLLSAVIIITPTIFSQYTENFETTHDFLLSSSDSTEVFNELQSELRNAFESSPGTDRIHYTGTLLKNLTNSSLYIILRLHNNSSLKII